MKVLITVESTNNRYHTMTALLEYIDRSLGFSINA